MARIPGAIEFSRRPALLVARYCIYAAEEQSGDQRRCGAASRLSISATVADDVCRIAPDKRKEHPERWSAGFVLKEERRRAALSARAGANAAA